MIQRAVRFFRHSPAALAGGLLLVSGVFLAFSSHQFLPVGKDSLKTLTDESSTSGASLHRIRKALPTLDGAVSSFSLRFLPQAEDGEAQAPEVPRSAIEVFQKNATGVCRIFRGCTDNDGTYFFPKWMETHKKLLDSRCGFHLASVKFVPSSILASWESSEGSDSTKDVLGAHMPLEKYERFVHNPVSFFFAREGTSYGSLHTMKHVTRLCLAEDRETNEPTICEYPPTPSLEDPVIILRSQDLDGKPFPVIRALREYFEKKQGRSLSMVDLSTSPNHRICFRSIASTHVAHAIQGETQRSLPKTDRASTLSSDEEDQKELDDLLRAVDEVLQRSENEIAKLASGQNDVNTTTSSDSTVEVQGQHSQSNVTEDSTNSTASESGHSIGNSTQSSSQPTDSDGDDHIARKVPDELSRDESQNNSSVSKSSKEPNAVSTSTEEGILNSSRHEGRGSESSAEQLAKTTERNAGNDTNTHEAKDETKQEIANSKQNETALESSDTFIHVDKFDPKAVESDTDEHSKKYDEGLCRAHNVCMREGSAKLIIPESSSIYMKDAIEACNSGFDIQTVPTEDYLAAVKNAFHDLDLIGQHVVRFPEHTFVSDMFPRLQVVDAVSPATYSKTAWKRIQGGKAGNAPVGRMSSRATDPVRASILVPGDLKNQQGTSSGRFIRGLLRMIPPAPHGPRLVFPGQLAEHNGMSCFKSVFAAKYMLPENAQTYSDSVGDRKSSFEIGHKYWRPYKSRKTYTSEGACDLRVSIMQPARDLSLSSNTTSGSIRAGSIENSKSLVQDIMQEAGQKKNVFFDVRVSSIVYEGNRIGPLRRQIRNADVIIGAHHPSLTSSIFAKPGSLLVEVHPHAYMAGPFDRFAKLMGLEYESVPALRDTEKFESCILTDGLTTWPETTSNETITLATARLLSAFEHNEGLRLDKEPRNEEEKKYFVPSQRYCARSQRIRIDTKYVAKLIVSHLVEKCDKQL